MPLQLAIYNSKTAASKAKLYIPFFAPQNVDRRMQLAARKQIREHYMRNRLSDKNASMSAEIYIIQG